MWGFLVVFDLGADGATTVTLRAQLGDEWMPRDYRLSGAVSCHGPFTATLVTQRESMTLTFTPMSNANGFLVVVNTTRTGTAGGVKRCSFSATVSK